MRNLVIGVFIGLLVGTMPAFAIGGWYTVDDLADTSRTFRLGYVAGVSDAFEAIASHPETNTLEPVWVEQYKCLSGHKQDKLGRFTDWAERKILQGRSEFGHDQGASFLMSSLCEL